MKFPKVRWIKHLVTELSQEPRELRRGEQFYEFFQGRFVTPEYAVYFNYFEDEYTAGWWDIQIMIDNDFMGYINSFCALLPDNGAAWARVICHANRLLTLFEKIDGCNDPEVKIDMGAP